MIALDGPRRSDGTISSASNEAGRVFTEGEVELAETIAADRGAIENARLSETKGPPDAETANQAKSDFRPISATSCAHPSPLCWFARIIQKRLQERLFPAIQSQDPRLKRAMEQVEENIGIIIAEGDRLTTLINDVLDLAKIEAGKLEWQLQPIHITEVIERHRLHRLPFRGKRPGIRTGDG
jgi:signal transduction histidine kinase